jgi:hypothetical protein
MGNDLSVWTWCSMRARSCRPSCCCWARLGRLLGDHLRKSRIISKSRRQADQFETAVLVRAATSGALPQHRTKGRAGTGMQSIFESGFGEFSRLRQLASPADQLLEGARRAMRVAQLRELDRLERNLATARDGRLDEPLRGPVRHRLGHHECVPQSRQCAAGDAGGGRAGHLRGA